MPPSPLKGVEALTFADMQVSGKKKGTPITQDTQDTTADEQPHCEQPLATAKPPAMLLTKPRAGT